MNVVTDTLAMRRRGARAVGPAWWLLIIPLALAGCYAPHVVDERDGLYCESEGLRAGTNANVDCATKREAERALASGTGTAEEPTAQSAAPVVSPTPPSHTGGVSQITPRSVAPGTTETINFSVSVNAECVFTEVPTVRIEKQPTNGIAKVIPLIDFARLSQNGIGGSCGDKKVSGISVQYTPNKNYLGPDVVEFKVMTRLGSTAFKVPITVEKRLQDEE